RAARAAARRRLELRVVVLPDGTDPADLVQSGGAAAIGAAVEGSVPFVRFRVERALSQGDHSSAEGRDRILDELRAVFATVPPSAMRMELTRMVSGRLGLGESLAERLLAGGAATAGRPGGAGRSGAAGRDGPDGRRERGGGREGRTAGAARLGDVLAHREESERAFLSLCIASPRDGAQALEGLDPESHFTSDVVRRAAAHLGDGHLSDPMVGVGPEDDALTRLLAELVVQAGREREAAVGEQSAAVMLRAQRLQLELARVERMIQEARVQGSGDLSELATRRTEVKRAFDRAQEAALEESGRGTG
ncbi:MAG: hypothetical protein FWD42_11300, partial [Solirubrobacterales bacterium]|nr:hypothetical protein [Solirubrobacterales bacterium]